MGLIIAAGNTKPAFPYDYYYGVKINTAVADPKLERVGRSELHANLPIQSLMRRCLLSDEGEVVTYLDANNSTKTDTGAAADLTGASGMVMVEIPEHYRKFEFDGKTITVHISPYQLQGFHKVPKMYRSAYEATVERATNKLASVVNTTAAYRGGNNSTTYDSDAARTYLGRPASDISLTNFRNYARKRGAYGLNGCGWNCDVYAAQLATYWLFVIEYANLNSQAAYNAQPDANGYKQGGLGDGVTTLDGNKWNTFNYYHPFVPCGITNSLGNKTGVVDYTLPAGTYDTNAVTVKVPSYRGIENPFGHIWSWTDGCKCLIQSDADGDKSLFYSCYDPAKFNSSGVNGYNLRGELPRSSGYFKAMMVGEDGDNMPTALGGGSTSYYCDYFYTSLPSSGVAERGVLFGGHANNGAYAGLSYAGTTNAASAPSANVGSRLCFIPEA